MFVSSTFLDTFEERDYLLKVRDGAPPVSSRQMRVWSTDTSTWPSFPSQHAFPAIKVWAHEFGLDFEMVDMRWGLPPHTTKSTFVVRTCMAEVEVRTKATQRVSHLCCSGDLIADARAVSLLPIISVF
jgi:hypothetical protein